MQNLPENESSGDAKPVEPVEKIINRDDSLWEHDQKRRSYYYDDSTGYEIYNPDAEDDEDDE